MKIITWNVNGIRAITKKGFLDWVTEAKADIIGIQETKADVDSIPPEVRQLDGYHTYFHSCSIKKGYSGVGVLSRIKPDRVSDKIGVEEFDQEGRILELDYGAFVLFNVYFPNGSSDHKRVPYKMRFYDALFAHCNALRAQGRGVIVMGDYNIAHTEIDLARPKENANTTGFLPIERARIDELVTDGWIDAFREYHPDEPDQYTYWDYFTKARERNVGWRIDYHLITPNLRPALKNGFILSDAMGSDHCPTGIVINP